LAALLLGSCLAIAATAKESRVDKGNIGPNAVDLKGVVGKQPATGPFVKTEYGFMVPYSDTIPGSDITFEMIPIPGGTFLMGSSSDDTDHQADEGPQVEITVPPLWVGKHEVTWSEYKLYMRLCNVFEQFEDRGLRQIVEDNEIDAITAPSKLYEPSFTFAPGDGPRQPAVSMSQYAAKQYTKWLSGIVGQSYRLPTEIEWEYAARAGSTTPYSFAAERSLDDYAWYAANSDDELQAVGTKLPNPWGLHDMHGSVAEWVLDEYDSARYSKLEEDVSARQAVQWPVRLYPRVIRGGCWFDDPAQCRSAARHKSEDPEWSLSDPNLPVSPWWFTEEAATGVGFRIVRPLAAMDTELKQRVWDADIKRIRQAVADRLGEGRGIRSGADLRLPAALKELEEAGIFN